ncbi:rhodanese-like domain-containing protein [Ramlibacter sp.]|uniref:rhodanese-like domain-containing protein n=1 Tax=Ramlibacter sp. TaxID=1917967 RepID=UPI0025CFFDBE|nr:rhodanese-like domain-containing protein [Ramlibacter sp.]
MPSSVTAVSPAASPEALAHFQSSLRFETDCWDVHDAMTSGKADFVLLDVRNPTLYAQSHVPGAVNLPQGKIVATKIAEYPEDTTFVVYCAGTHCNGAQKSAIRLAALGRPVKLMVGGLLGWIDEGFTVDTGAAQPVAEPAMALG